MATVGTSTQSDLLSYPSLPSIARDVGTSVLAGRVYAVIRTAADTLTVYRSLDNGGSWASWTSFTHAGLQEWSRLYVDTGGYAHIAYRINAASADSIHYRRVALATGTWSAALQTSGSDANGGVAGSRWQGVDIGVVRHADGAYAIAVCGGYAEGGARFGLFIMGVSIRNDGLIYGNDGLISVNRQWIENGTPPGRIGVVCEIEQRGDGITSNTPHLWVGYGRTSLRMVKLAWQGGGAGIWTGPPNPQIIRTTITAHDYFPARWDGRQWLMGVINPDDATSVRVYQRNQANTATSAFDTPTHPTGNIRHMGLSFDDQTKNIRVFAVGTSTAVLYYTDYVRGSSTWTAWATAVATAIGPGAGEFGVKAGGSANVARHDILTTASGSPNTVSHTAMVASSIPNNATWASPGTDLFSGGPRDIAAGLLLDWEFIDPDPGQAQGSYALSRQIGAGTIAYWRASDSTWQPAEVQNATASTSVTLPAAWGANADLPHTYKVKVWDDATVAALGYSDQWVVVPSALVNPTVSAPTAAQVLTTDRVTVTWTVAEQTAYKITLNTNPAGGVAIHDTGWVSDTTTTSYTVPVSLGNGTAWTVTLATKNNEGLPSTTTTRNFTVQYSAPPATISTLAPSTTLGYIAVTASTLAAVGSQPTVTTLDLYRRPVTVTALNTNPTFSGNTTGYFVGGGSGGTLTYSTTQSAPGSSPGAARLVPNGSGATPAVEANSVVIDVTRSLEATAWVRPDTANKPVTININWYTSGSVYISTTALAISAPVATAWQFMRVVANPTLVPTAARASISVGLASTPAAGDAIYADEMRLRAYDTTTGVRVAQGATGGTTFNDWGAASGIDYEYQWVGNGSNGTSISGPWTS